VFAGDARATEKLQVAYLSNVRPNARGPYNLETKFHYFWWASQMPQEPNLREILTTNVQAAPKTHANTW